MMDKEDSIKYWNKMAKDWKYMAYDTNKKATIFPSSQLRQEIVVNEIKKHVDKDAKILDIGCADGSLIIELLKNGYTNVEGMDNSSGMVKEAKKRLKDLGYDSKIVYYADIDNFYSHRKYDIVVALGLIEYVEDLDCFLELVGNLLSVKGIAFIESKNKLFNIFSANEYTVNTPNLSKLIEELDDIFYLSPNKSEDVVLNTYINIGKKLSNFKKFTTKKVKHRKYPFDLPQYSPNELIYRLSVFEMKTKNIIYYHCHPFPPRYRDDFPVLYDELSVMMQPLGYTPIGALICSSFVMVIEK